LYNTSIEKKVLKNINKIFKGTVICPNNNIGDLNDPRDYLTISGKADVIFVSPPPEHEEYLSKGCFKEVENALNNYIPVIVIQIENEKIILKYLLWVDDEKKKSIVKYAYMEPFHLF
jgi:hypothetical protein